MSTPTLGVSEAYRASAEFVGAVLMLVTAVVRLLERAGWKQVTVSGLLVVAGGGVLWALSPALMELGNANLVIFFLLMLVACVAIGVPIAFAFGLSTLCYLALSTATPLSVIPNRMQEGMSHLILLAVPLFIFLGGLIEMTGLARAMINFLASLIGTPAWRASVCAAWGDVHCLGHLGLQGGGHGRGGTSVVSGNEEPRRTGRRPDRAAVGLGAVPPPWPGR